MTDTLRPGRTSGTPLVPLGLLFVALLALCGAVVYPFQQLFWQLSPTALLATDAVLPVPARVGVVVVGLLALVVVATTYSVVLLIGRL